MVKHCRELQVPGSFSRVVESQGHKNIESLARYYQHNMLTKTTGRVGGTVDVRLKSPLKLKCHLATDKPREKKKVKKVIVKYIEDSDSDQCTGSSDDSYSSSSESEPSPPKRRKNSYKRQKNGNLTRGSQKEIGAKKQEQSEDEYVVEDIVDMKEDQRGKRFFFVKWENYDSSDNTWEPLENLQKCQDIVREFLKKRENSVSDIQTSESDPSTTDEDVSDNSQPSGTTEEINSETSTCFTSAISNSMLSSFRKVANDDLIACEALDIKPVKDPKCAEEVSKHVTDTYIQIPQSGGLFYIRIIDDGDGQLNWVYIDTTQPLLGPDIYYKCVVTEDLTGKQPKLVIGATTAVDGEKFCLVQFEGHSYIEVIPPEFFFDKFPSFKRYFEMHYPQLFSNNTQ